MWLDDPEVRELISSQMARDFHVIPLASTPDGIDLLVGRFLSEAELAKVQEVIAFYKQCEVRLHSLAERPELQDKFDALLQRYYNDRLPDGATEPIASDLMSVLLFIPDSWQRNNIKRAMEEDGYDVVEAGSLKEALDWLADPSWQFPFILLPPKEERWPERDFCRKKLKSVTTAKIRAFDPTNLSSQARTAFDSACLLPSPRSVPVVQPRTA